MTDYIKQHWTPEHIATTEARLRGDARGRARLVAASGEVTLAAHLQAIAEGLSGLTTAAARPLWLHLGVVPTRASGRPAALRGLTSDQHAPVPGMPGVFVDGSWETWGEPAESPRSLHLVTCVDPVGLTSQADDTRRRLHRRLRRGSRVVDHAVVTTDDWSEVVGLVTFDLATAYYSAVI